MEEQIKSEKGFTKDNVKKLFTWEGGWQEWFWIIFFIMLLLTYLGYREDMKVCKQIQDEEVDFYNNLIKGYNNFTANFTPKKFEFNLSMINATEK